MKYIKVAGASVNQTPLDWKGNADRLIAARLFAKMMIDAGFDHFCGRSLN